MKIRILSMFVILVLCLGICGAYAQEAPKDQLHYLLYVVVEPSMADAYEANHKKLLAEYAKHGYKFPFSVFTTNAFEYYFLFNFDKLDDINEFIKAGEEIRTKVGADTFDAIWSGYGGKYKYYRTGFYTRRADLSYFPETPRLKPEEMNFIVWLNYSLKTDKELEAEKVMKEWVSLFKSKKIDTGFLCFKGGIGSDVPYLSVSLAGKSAVDYFTQAEKHDQIMGKEMAELWKKTFATTQKFEVKMGMPRPDLSYTPKEPAAAAK
jgi:hypothetical protein